MVMTDRMRIVAEGRPGKVHSGPRQSRMGSERSGTSLKLTSPRLNIHHLFHQE